MKDESKELVILRDGEKYLYGKLIIGDEGTAGEIKENLLQDKLIIYYDSEEEKNEILSVVPDGFYTKIEKKMYGSNSINVEFEQQEISAPLYANTKHVFSGYMVSKATYRCEDTKKIETISATLKTQELTKQIIDFMANIYRIKSKYTNKEYLEKSDVRSNEDYRDKYDASSECKYYLQWLVGTGQAEALDINGQVSLEEYTSLIHSRFDSTSYRVRYNGREYNISFGDADSYSYYQKFDGLEKDYQKFVEKLKEQGEYFLPGTKIPRYKIPKSGIAVVKSDENEYVLADRTQIYSQLSGTPIFNGNFILTDDKSIVYGSGEQEDFSDMMHTKIKDSDYIETETFIGYNDDQIMFIHDKGKSYRREILSDKVIQRFEREDSEHPVSMFSIGDTIGFVDGNKVRLSDEKGELSTFEIEEEIQSIEVQNGYVLINGSILCCGARYKEKSWSHDEKITPFCKKINNPKRIENFMKDVNSLQQSSFIENENGCFFTEGLTEEEKLRLYQENGFSELYEKLESTIIARQEAQREEERIIEEAKNKTNEYLEGKVLSLCHLRKNSSYRGKIIEADNVEFVENEDAVVLYEKQEKGWGYGPVYDTGIIYVPEAKKRAKGGKLHLDVPEDLMGMIIGRQGANINGVTAILKEKGVDLSKIILHPKSRNEIKITLDSIEKVIKEQRVQSHDTY